MLISVWKLFTDQCSVYTVQEEKSFTESFLKPNSEKYNFFWPLELNYFSWNITKITSTHYSTMQVLMSILSRFFPSEFAAFRKYVKVETCGGRHFMKVAVMEEDWSDCDQPTNRTCQKMVKSCCPLNKKHQGDTKNCPHLKTPRIWYLYVLLLRLLLVLCYVMFWC